MGVSRKFKFYSGSRLNAEKIRRVQKKHGLVPIKITFYTLTKSTFGIWSEIAYWCVTRFWKFDFNFGGQKVAKKSCYYTKTRKASFNN